MADGQFVKIVQDCSGKFHFLPYHLSTNTQYNAVSSSSVFLDDYARYALYSFRLEITPMAWNEAQNLSQSLGQHAITPYPYNYVEIIPLTFFARRRDIIISYAPHISRQSAIYSTNLYIQVHGEHNIDTLAQFLAQSASILFEQRIGLTIEDETQVITTIQLKIGSLRQSNVTQ